MGKHNPLRFEDDRIASPHFAGRENRGIDSRTLPMLLNYALQNFWTRIAGCRVESDHHATLINFSDGDSRCAPNSESFTDPLQLVERPGILQINQQIGTKAPRIFLRSTFFRDARNRLYADEGDRRDIVRPPVITQQKERLSRSRLEHFAEVVALNGPILSMGCRHRHGHLWRARLFDGGSVVQQLRQLARGEPRKRTSGGRLNERIASVLRETLKSERSRRQRLTLHGLNWVPNKLANNTHGVHAIPPCCRATRRLIFA